MTPAAALQIHQMLENPRGVPNSNKSDRIQLSVLTESDQYGKGKCFV
jgi:hypothetical protein